MTTTAETYRILLVDDEPLFRLALRTLLSESGLPLHIVGEASDGREAMKWVRSHPELDIVIVDMKMPGVSGIDFLRELYGEPAADAQPSQPVSIVLSAYQDYALVRQAFVLGAFDYIVKVDLDKSHVVPVLEKAIRKIDSRKIRLPLQNGMETGEKDILLRRVLEEDDPKALEALSESFVSQPGQNRALVVIRTDVRRDGPPERGGVIRQTLEQTLQAEGMPAEIVRMRDSEYAALMEFGQNRSFLYCRNRLNELMTTVRQRLLRFANVSVSAGATGPHTGRTWADLYREANRLAAFLFFCGYGKVFFPEAAKAHDLGRTATEAEEAEFAASGKAVLQALADPNPDEWKRKFGEWRNRGVPWRDEEKVRARFTDFVWEIGVLLHHRERRWDQLEEPYPNPFLLLQQCDTLQQLWDELEELLGRVHTLIHESRGQGNHILQKAKAYIEKHYGDGITLTLISKMVGVSESHLSKLFVKETGENFIDYLTKIRIRQAIEWMKTDMKLYEIAEKVGYLNPEHFSRVFKKTMGMSPAQYREQLESQQKISRNQQK
jgi:two-component system response regulator YesN